MRRRLAKREEREREFWLVRAKPEDFVRRVVEEVAREEREREENGLVVLFPFSISSLSLSLSLSPPSLSFSSFPLSLPLSFSFSFCTFERNEEKSTASLGFFGFFRIVTMSEACIVSSTNVVWESCRTVGRERE